jgi:hypothetical protein
LNICVSSMKVCGRIVFGRFAVLRGLDSSFDRGSSR